MSSSLPEKEPPSPPPVPIVMESLLTEGGAATTELVSRTPLINNENVFVPALYLPDACVHVLFGITDLPVIPQRFPVLKNIFPFIRIIAYPVLMVALVLFCSITCVKGETEFTGFIQHSTVKLPVKSSVALSAMAM